MRVLIIGGGGREHALAWSAVRSPQVRQVWVAPGNAGTAQEPGVENVAVDVQDMAALARFAADRRVDLSIVGPEAPLVAGITDQFARLHLPCFGPSQAASRLEGSKFFTRSLCARHNIPMADGKSFTEVPAALDYLRRCTLPIVIKADGLAAGKGVVIAAARDQACQVATEMLSGQRHGDAGRRIIIEEYLPGEELSFIALSDGENLLPLASARDHKTRDDRNRGPNTGGMGACSPAPDMDADLQDRIITRIMQPAVRGMAQEGMIYRGFLYAGLKILPGAELRLLEFNCRLGDPEAQPILLRLNSDLPDLCLAALQGCLSSSEIVWDRRAATGIVLAAAGYPGKARVGDPIQGLDRPQPDGVKVFHSGTAVRQDQVVSAGGRVLCVTALGADLAQARSAAYDAAACIRWPGMFYRKDIGAPATPS